MIIMDMVVTAGMAMMTMGTAGTIHRVMILTGTILTGTILMGTILMGTRHTPIEWNEV